MYRIHSNLLKNGVESTILCEKKTSIDPNVLLLPPLTSKERRLKKISEKLGLNDIYRISSFRIANNPAYLNSDIINFHGIHSGFINYLALPGLTRNKPAVFTLRDMWCLTGHCGYSFDCDRWKTGCGKCPYPEVYPPVQRDATHIEWLLKRWVYKRSSLTLVALSKWMIEAVKQSILGHFPIHHIPNGVDIEAYQPLDKMESRNMLGIPQNKQIILFGSANLNDPRKGGDLVIEIIRNLPVSLKTNLCLLLFGPHGEKLEKSVDVDCINLGYISDQRKKTAAYSAAEVLLFPSKNEMFGNIILESMACGTPIVSFPIGGSTDVVYHGKTGFLAELENTGDFSACLVRILQDETMRKKMSENCRSLIVNEYSTDVEIRKYMDLYDTLL